MVGFRVRGKGGDAGRWGGFCDGDAGVNSAGGWFIVGADRVVATKRHVELRPQLP